MNLREILEAHKRWLNNEEGGKRANLREADLRGADLREADLPEADLSGANLREADLRGADLSGAKGLLNPIDYIKENFEATSEGIICYKTFGNNYTPPSNWVIAPGSIIEEVVNPLPTLDCACGVNVATLDWVKENDRDIWRCLIRWEWLAGVCVPLNTDGKIRAARVQLLEVVPRD